MAKINFVGVQHFDRNEDLYSSLSDSAENSEAIFFERSDSNHNRKYEIKAFLTNPSVVAFLLVYRFLGYLFTLLKNRSFQTADEKAVERISEENELPSYNVDKDIFAVIKQHPTWMPLSWLFFSAVVYSTYEVAITQGLGAAISGTLLTVSIFLGFLIYYPFIKTTVPERNAYMLMKSLAASESEDYEEITLVVGAGHLSNMEEMAERKGLDYEVENIMLTQRIKRRITSHLSSI